MKFELIRSAWQPWVWAGKSGRLILMSFVINQALWLSSGLWKPIVVIWMVYLIQLGWLGAELYFLDRIRQEKQIDWFEWPGKMVAFLKHVVLLAFVLALVAMGGVLVGVGVFYWRVIKSEEMALLMGGVEISFYEMLRLMVNPAVFKMMVGESWLGKWAVLGIRVVMVMGVMFVKLVLGLIVMGKAENVWQSMGMWLRKWYWTLVSLVVLAAVVWVENLIIINLRIITWEAVKWSGLGWVVAVWNGVFRLVSVYFGLGLGGAALWLGGGLKNRRMVR